MLEQEVKIDANLIESFKSQKELHGELDKYSDSELMKRMNKEIKGYGSRKRERNRKLNT